MGASLAPTSMEAKDTEAAPFAITEASLRSLPVGGKAFTIRSRAGWHISANISELINALRPDCVDAQVVDLLQELSRQTFITLELGLQSAHDQTLNAINRAHTFEEFADAMDLCTGRGFDLCVHIILGLPGENRGHWNLTASALKRWKYEGIKIHPLHVVKGTVLEEQYSRSEYRVLDFEEYVQGLVDFLERISPEVGVQRFTGDAMGELLVAPAWCKDKNSVLRAMHSEFERRGTHQGFHWNR
jgi:uncharacterized protein